MANYQNDLTTYSILRYKACFKVSHFKYEKKYVWLIKN